MKPDGMPSAGDLSRRPEPVAAQTPDTEEWLNLGKLYHVRGQDVLLFPVGALAAALRRVPNTIRKWEQRRWLPVPGVRGKTQGLGGRRRLYSAQQIRALVQIARDEGLLDDLTKAVSKTDFPARAAGVPGMRSR